MEQDCTCHNHVQCNTIPTTLISEVVSPSYQHFLQRIHQTGTTKRVSNETDAIWQDNADAHASKNQWLLLNLLTADHYGRRRENLI